MASRQPPDFGRLIARLSRELSAHGLSFMLIGGQAVLLHGVPRLTEDIDVTLGVGPEELASVLQVCATLRLMPVPTDVESFVNELFVLPVRDETTGIRIDLVFSTTPYEQQAIAHAQRVMIEGVSVPFATAEDLLIHKLFSGRPRDLEDATGVARRNRTTLDWDYVATWAHAFAEIPGREGMLAQLRQLRERA
jgi:predicted nucleotidyltransferase